MGALSLLHIRTMTVQEEDEEGDRLCVEAGRSASHRGARYVGEHTTS